MISAIGISIMTHHATFPFIEDNGDFIKCLHSVGYPLEHGQEDAKWPCNPEKVLVAHKPHNNEIVSFGSGYGGNSLLGKKCFALRIGSAMAKKEGWLAEHMLIMGVKCPNESQKRYVVQCVYSNSVGPTYIGPAEFE